MHSEGNYVPGEGPTPCDIMLIGESPGKHENTLRRPFVGPSGQVLWQLVWRHLHLDRESVYVTNLVKRQPSPDNDDPTPEMIQRDWPELTREMEAVRPRFIITLGRHSFKALTGLDLPMEITHGKAWAAPALVVGDATVISVTHPAAGLRSPQFLAYTGTDLEQAAQIIRGGETHLSAVDGPPFSFYRMSDTTFPIQSPSHPRYGGTPLRIGLDTEGSASNPFCLTFCFSHAPSIGYAIHASDKEAIRAFAAFLKLYEVEIIFHHALHDLDVLRAMGIDILELGLQWEDNILLTNLLDALEPNGLKPLAARHCGVLMTPYEDVVRPHYRDHLYHHFAMEKTVIECEWQITTTPPVKLTKTGKPFKIQPKPITGWRINTPPDIIETYKLISRWVDQAWKGGLGSWTEFNWESRLKGAEDKQLPLLSPDLLPPFDLSVVPESKWLQYACTDAICTVSMHQTLKTKAGELGVMKAYEQDKAVLPIWEKMKTTGFLINLERVARLESDLKTEISGVEESIRIFHEDLNPASGDQVADYLFSDLRLPSQGMTKGRTRETTDDAALESITHLHPVVGLILQYRELSKLLTSYVSKFPSMVKPSGRIEMDIRNTSVVSGRISGFLLTMPARGDWAKRVRSCFVAPPGKLLGSWDLSQIELRVFAHLSQEPKMIEVLRAGKDLHLQTAEGIFKDPGMRRPAKDINFGILYGIGAQGLLHQFKKYNLSYTLADCERIISDWFALYPQARRFYDDTFAQVRRDGFVREPWSGRIRHLPGVWLRGERWPHDFLRAEAERAAGNFRIQTRAKAYHKGGLIRLWDIISDWGPSTVPLLDIHDDIVLEFPDGEQEMMDSLLKDVLTSEPLLVPVLADGHWGADWSLLK